ncbi:MAG: hypothetical protein RID07_10245, partial [Lacipirellulaceae bacterium]
IKRLEGEKASLETQVKTLKGMRFREGGEQATLELRVVREKLAATEEQLTQRLKDRDRLRITAPIDGTVIPPLRVPEPPGDKEEELATWYGSPLDKKNLGALLTPDGPQNLLCQIGDPKEWDAVLVINQDDIADVRRGQEVRIMFEESVYHVYVTEVEYVASNEELDVAPPRLASTSGGPLPSQPDADGVTRPIEKAYRAQARLSDPQGLLRHGLIGQARIETEPRTVAARLGRYLSRTFNFDL